VKLPQALTKPTVPELIDAGCLLALCTIAGFAFRSSYGGIEFAILEFAAAALGIVLAHVSHGLKWPLIVGIAATFTAYVLVGGAVSLRDQAIAGFLPSTATILAALRMMVTGWKELLTTAPPVGHTGDLMVLPFFAGISSGFASYTMARRIRRSTPVLIPSTAVLAVGIAAGIDRPVSLVLHGCVFGGLAIAWLARRDHSRRTLLEGSHSNRRHLLSGAGVLAVACAAGLFLAPLLPFANHRVTTAGTKSNAATSPAAKTPNRAIWRQVIPPFDPQQYPSPLSGYRHYVKEATVRDEVMFTISGLPAGIPVRLATMDSYDQFVWKVSAGNPDHPALTDSGSFERVGVALEPEFPGQVATVTVRIGKYNDVWVPDVGEVISLTFVGSKGVNGQTGADRDRQLAEGFRYNLATDTGANRVVLTEGDRYVMNVRLPVMAEKLAGKTLIPAMPNMGVVTDVSLLQQKLVGPDVLAIKDSGEQLDTIRKVMSEGTYSDGDTASGVQQKSLGGHSSFRLTDFANQYPKQPLIGNAEQYAAAYAVIFRNLHVPTRVVIGFRPSKDSTSQAVDVTAKEIEAWVEVPIEKDGWVAVFPTPDRSHTALTSSSEQQPEPDYRTQNPPPPPVLDPEFDQPATAAGKAKSTKAPKDPSAVKEAKTTTPLVSKRVVIGAAIGGSPFLLFGLASLVIVLLKARRRKRRRLTGLAHQRIANGWLEVTDLAVDMGRPIPGATTRREAAAFAGSGTSALAVRADAAVWDAGEPSDKAVEEYWAELTSTLKAMRSELGVVHRVKSNISIRSLRLSDRVRHRDRSRK
jgi:Transglutaminase-like superfamily